MSDKEELFTDYALQLFSSYLAKDVTTMELLMETFQNEGKNSDPVFLPGLLYGMMYHFGVLLEGIALVNDVSPEEIFQGYAMAYANDREYLIDNPLLNIAIVRESVQKLIDEVGLLKEIAEDLKKDL